MVIIFTFDIIVPCYNEAETIEKFYDKINETVSELEDFDTRFIFIDDGSKDNTSDIIKKIANHDSRVAFVSFSRNFGKEAAMLAGLKFSNADFTCIMDADLQHPPELIKPMLDALIANECDVAAAKRKSRKDERGIRTALSSQYYKIMNKVSDIHLEQNAQDFRIMKRKVVNAILCMRECSRFSKGIFSWVGYNTKWFEHEDVERVAGETKWSFRMLLNYAVKGFLSFSCYPFKIPLKLSILTGFASIVEFILILLGRSPMPAGDITLTILLVTTLLLFSIGIMCQYFAELFTEVKHRPDFIITETNVVFDDNRGENRFTFDVIQTEDYLNEEPDKNPIKTTVNIKPPEDSSEENEGDTDNEDSDGVHFSDDDIKIGY